MSRISMRRVVATTAAATMVGAGLTVGLGSGIAAAADAQCSPTASQVREPLIAAGPLKHKYTYEKSVTPQVAAGTLVTITTKISTAEGLPLVNSVTDHAPAGYTATAAYVTANHAIGGDKREKVQFSASGDGIKVANGAGWMLGAAHPVTVEVQYVVPAGAAVGTTATTGGTEVTGTLKIDTNLSDLNVCTTIRPKNAGESVTGSLGQSGLGSSDGQLSSTGSVSDILGDTISKVLKNGS